MNQDIIDALNELIREIKGANTRMRRIFSGKTGDLAFNIKDFSDTFKTLMKSPILEPVKNLTSQLKQFEKTQKKALALGINANQVFTDSVMNIAQEFGVNAQELATEILSLKEVGIKQLDDSTLSLVARMKLTSQDTKALTRFLSSNTSVMMLNQEQAQKLGVNIAKYSEAYGTRQDEMLNLASTLSQSFRVQNQLGAGGRIEQAFTALASKLGGRSADLVKQAGALFASLDLSKMIQLGIESGFQESLAMESDPEKQAKIVERMLRTAAASIQERTAGLGLSVTDRQIYKDLINTMGGPGILVFSEITKALDDAKEPLTQVVQPFFSLSQAMDALKNPMIKFTAKITELLNNETLGKLAKGLLGFIGSVGSVLLAIRSLMGVVAFLKPALLLLRATPMGLVATTLAAIGTTLYGMWGESKKTAENTEALNRKTPDQTKPQTQGPGLQGQIFSQLISIIGNQNNDVQRESLRNQKELIMLARQQVSFANPQTSIPAPSTGASRR